MVLVTFMAACLSFVVVFTLSNTNISERERELATIKVLGFRRGEVHHYVNKETLILTAIGAALGVPLGSLLAESFTYILQMPSLYFDVEVEPLSYVLCRSCCPLPLRLSSTLPPIERSTRSTWSAPSRAPSNLPKRDRFILAGFIWANAGQPLGGPAFAPFCWGCLSFSALTGQSSVAHSS